MNRILLTFAAQPNAKPLPTLREEDEGVWKALSVHDRKGAIRLSREQHATTQKITEQLETYKEDVCLFLYSGHAGQDSLFLEDGIAHARGLALLLGDCARYSLKVVVLNGCSTEGQVSALLQAGVPVVIATSAPVNDNAATRFSIAFFKALAEASQTIWEAFLTGLRAAQTVSRQDPAALQIRSIGLSVAAGQATWGLYCYPEQRNLAETWKIPDAPPVGNCDCNRHLRKALDGVYNKHLKLQQAERADWAKVALERLPFPVSEPLRKLLAGKAQTQESNVFYETATPERFEMLLYAYRSILNLNVFVLLAELWDKITLPEVHVRVPDKIKAEMRRCFFIGRSSESDYSPLLLLQMLCDWHVQNENHFLIPDILAVVTDLQTKKPLRLAVEYLETKNTNRDELMRNKSSQAFMCDLCDDTEDNLAKIVFAFGFLSQYGLTSIKNIDVLKFRHQKKATFLHRIVKLQIAYIDSEDERYVAEKYLETSSIILHRHNDWKGKMVNLAPFYIDKNAMLGTPKANLHYLLSVSTKNGVYHFGQVSHLNEVWAVRPPAKPEDDFFELPDEEGQGGQEEYYSMLNQQINAFKISVFGETSGGI